MQAEGADPSLVGRGGFDIDPLARYFGTVPQGISVKAANGGAQDGPSDGMRISEP